MRIFIDIGHPAHVHYFRNFMQIMNQENCTFFVSSRNRSIIFELLKIYNIPFYDRGKGSDRIIGKLFYLLIADLKLFFKAKKFKPDIFLSFASPYTAHVAWFLKKPHIVLDDTEHARFGHLFYKPFSKVFLNPTCFKKDFGPKQIRFKSFTELFYLHPNYLSNQPDISVQLKLLLNHKFALLRFVSWKANHDIGHSGLDIETKKQIINTLVERGYRVFISSEGENQDGFFEKFLIKFSPDLIHQVMSKAELLITEGATMASECAMLGIPAIYVNSLDAGSLRELEDKYQLIHGFRSPVGVLEKVLGIINSPDTKRIYQIRRQRMLTEKIDITAFLVWFIKNYPGSAKIMKDNPEYQNRFNHN